ncbi:hypothetical protein U9M48_042469 [Paspalum notatum var. saurae]|uniref:Uncharacterized protein n=1 Tax=Paspalum notatum var. saurae TaxID=547442 RepID=A0AAQ3USN4_PASNO
MALVVLDRLADGLPAVKAALALVVPLLLLVLLRHFTGAARSNRQQKRMPPSPWAMPLIGHLHLIVGGHPHVSLRNLAARQPQGGGGFMLLRLGTVPTLVVSSSHAAQQVLRTHDKSFASRPRSVVGDILSYAPLDVGFAPYGEWWRQAKKLVTTHLLTAKKVESYRAAREEEVGAVIAEIRGAAAAQVAVDMSEILSSFTNDILCRAVVGRSFRVEGRNKVFRELIDVGMVIVGGFNLENFYPGLAKVAGGVLTWPARRKAEMLRSRWDNIFDALIDEHERDMAGGDMQVQESDFIHVLLSVQGEYGLTRNSIKGILADMFTAGTGTAYLVLEFAMAELMLHQHALAKLQAEVREIVPKNQETVNEGNLSGMAYLKAVVKETLRLHPPSPLLVPHLCIEDCNVDSYMVPAKTTVFINAWAIGRDQGMWAAPDEFMPERFIDNMGDITGADFGGNDFQFLPFGSGRRICPGINFALASIEIMLANLAYHFDWELPQGVHHIDMTEVFGLTVRRKEKLLLIPRSTGFILPNVE